MKTSRIFSAVLPALALVACPGPGEPVDTADLWVDPCPVLQLNPADGVAWPETPVGVEWEAELWIENACDGENLLVVDLAIEAEGPFFLRDDSVTVPPGDAVRVGLWFLAQDEEAHTAELRVKTHGQEAVLLPLTGQGTTHVDRDEDGYVDALYGGTDCDDADASIFPGAEETLDLADEDCDGLVDEDFLEAGDVLITELMVDPVATEDARGEWLELTNQSGRDLDLVGWAIVDYSYADRIVFEESFLVLDGMRVVIGPEADPQLNGGVEIDRAYKHADLDLTDVYDDLELRAGDLTVAAVTWDADWWIGTPGAAWSLDPRITDVWDALNRTYWCSATEPLPSGDFGTPGRANPTCDLASDADEDGWTVGEGDCDDTDPTVNPDALEVWGNRIDDDCDGLADLALADDVAAGFLDGDSSDHLGWRNHLGTGDLDGDGAVELVVGSWLADAGAGGVWVLEGADYASWSGGIDGYSEARWRGTPPSDTSVAQVGAISQLLGDVTGDGLDDLVVGGSDTWGSAAYAAVVLMEGPVTGDYGITDVTAAITGSRGYTNHKVHSGLDLDGDGVCEIVHGDGWSYTGSTFDHTGVVSVFTGGTLTGGLSLDDADHQWDGPEDESYLGAQIGGGDLDGDGLDDLVLTAWGEPTRGTWAGAAYVLMGDDLPPHGEISWSARILADTADDRLGKAGAPQVADLDGDGSADLALSAHHVDKVYLFLGAGSLEGTWDASDAEVILSTFHGPHELGTGLAAGDLDADGVDDLLVGAPDDDKYDAHYAWYEGAAYALFAPGAGSSRLYVEDAGAVIEDDDPLSGFGQSALAADLDGDGRAEALVGATNEGTHGSGRVWVFEI